MSRTLTLRDYQQEGVDAVRNIYIKGKRSPLYVLPTGGGKCLGKNTPILMFDGSIKMVQDVKQGDLLIGPDSKPRRVFSTCIGREELYKVIPTKGDPYIVNKSHILSLKRTTIYKNPKYPSEIGGGIINISVEEYIQKSNHFKHQYKGWRSEINFKRQSGDLNIDPYYLGLWLGDGTSRTNSITTGDQEIKSFLSRYSDVIGLKLRIEPNSVGSEIYHLIHIKGHQNRLIRWMKEFDLYENKHIPRIYLTAAKFVRLELLAGVMDSDGHYNKKGYDLTLKSERLIDDIIFLARSLGFSAYKSKCKKSSQNGTEGNYFRCFISGNVDLIPCKISRKKAGPRQQKKNVLLTGIKVEPIGIGDYYGFEIDGDRLFLLGDFTVTHNTIIFSYIAANTAVKNKRVLILVHRIELLRQTSEKLIFSNIEHGLINAKFTPNAIASVQIASVQTLVRRLDKVRLDYDLIIIDEAHHAVANTWKKIINRIPKARILGVTATPIRGDGSGLSDLFDSLIIGPSVKRLTERGYLAPSVVYAPTEKLDLSRVKIVNGDYDQREIETIVDNSNITGSAIDYYKRICPGVPTIVFCVSVAHAEHVANEFKADGFRFHSIDGTMDDAERRKLIHGLTSGNIQGLTSCDLISEGTDIPRVICGILLRPTQSTGLFLQQVGRILRPSDDKARAIILDHVGNVLSHGMPDEERAWTLEGETRRSKKKKNDDEPNIRVKQCPQCFAMHGPAPKCPLCGHIYVVEDSTPSTIDGELREITKDDAALIKRMRNREVGQARTFDELVKIGSQRGYKPGWAKHIWQSRQKAAPPPIAHEPSYPI